MPSTFTWLDHSEEARRRALDAIDLFRQPETRDELGLATVRDGIANVLSPGTSTIQTRIRYFLLIPWLYQWIERKHSSRPAAARARSAELDLIEALMRGGDHDGLIGRSARRSLKRLPSGVYWQGLHTWGIRPVPVALDAYHRWIDAGTATDVDHSEEGEPVHGIWHAGLPPMPSDFPTEATLTLTHDEADYLLERLTHRRPDALLTWSAHNGTPVRDVAFPWAHPALQQMPAPMRTLLDHARMFSEALHGAALLYNLLLARQTGRAEWIEHWEQRVEGWSAFAEERGDALRGWDLDAFWHLMQCIDATPDAVTQRFCSQWIELARTTPTRAADDERSADLVRGQEVHVKRKQARLQNRSMLEAWGGDSGSSQLSYRWGITRTYISELLESRRA